MATAYGGYMGLVLDVDLTNRTVSEYPWTDEQRKLFIGGKIMAAKILLDNMKGDEEPLSPENLVVIATGPLTGTGAPSSSRFDISTRSPQTGFLTSSNCGGNFGYHLKKAGIDAMILRGRCEGHTWICIKNGEFEFRSADEDGLWGLRTGEAQEKMRELVKGIRKRDMSFGRLTIGPAGENQVLYSCVVSQERVSGRGGVGAVLGAKNLKGIAVWGSRNVQVRDPEKSRAWNRHWFQYLKDHPLTGSQLPRLGTAGLVSSMQMRGLLSTKNYNYGQYDRFEDVSGEKLAEEYNIVNKGCLTCPIKCARTVEIDGHEVKGPELETLGLLGGGILNPDLSLILRWNYELDELGLDTISAASTLAYAMEANEKGLWDNGLEFGKTDGVSAVFEDIAFVRGIGKELSLGTKRLSAIYGGEEFAINAKGMELAAYEPRRAVGQGLGYAVSNRGGCHLNGGYLVILEGLGLNADSQTPKGKADFTMMFQDLMEMISATGQCLFTSYAFFPRALITRPNSGITRTVNAVIPHIGGAVRFINRIAPGLAIDLPIFPHTKGFRYATGMKMTFGKYIFCGERGYDLERYVNTSLFGASAKDDTLPSRLTETPQDPDDPTTVVPLDRLKKSYYKARGWDENGIPTEKTLRRLSII